MTALLVHTLVFAYPPVIQLYGDRYRGSSGWVRDVVHDADITNAIVFVEPGNWSWKSAFPLNRLPLDSNDVLFARDLREENRALAERYPGRAFYRVLKRRGQPTIERLNFRLERGSPLSQLLCSSGGSH